MVLSRCYLIVEWGERMPGVFDTIVFILLVIFILGGVGYLFILICKVLRKFLRSSSVRKEKDFVKRSLGEAIKEHRTNCKMTQEFVAETLGVSRQAVSKWESGITDPSTSNLIELAKLFKVSPEELLKGEW